MTIMTGYIDTFEEAAQLAFLEAQAIGVKPEVAALFATMLEPGCPQQEAEKLVGSAIRGQYGKATKWDIEEWRQVPVTSPRYEARGVPRLIMETKAYMVACVEITPGWSRRTWYVSVVQPLGKPQTTLLPLCFLRALLDGDLDRYQIAGKDGPWTSWELAGLRQPLRLHDSFVRGLRRVFKLKPLADWLEDFGSHGQSLLPLVVGAMLGLMHQDSGDSLSTGQQPWSQKSLLEVITGMGYSTARAERVLERAEPELRAGMTLEEAIRVVLKYIGKEG